MRVSKAEKTQNKDKVEAYFYVEYVWMYFRKFCIIYYCYYCYPDEIERMPGLEWTIWA